MKKKHVLRYFFTATEESAKWIQAECKRLGLQPPEFIRMMIHQIMSK